MNLLWSFVGLIGIYAILFAIALRSHGGFLGNLRALLHGSKPPGIPNWLIVMPFLSSALLLVVIGVTSLLDKLGIPTGSLQPRDPYFTLYALTYSPILEEIMFRISTLGLLVALRALWSGTWKVRIVAISFLSPERVKAVAGLPRISEKGLRGLHWTEWLLLAITSSLFGLAHLLAGGGWQPGKVVTATISGLALGISFLTYGAYASILLHWFFNFYFETFALGADLLHGGLGAIGELVSLLTLALGILGIALALAWLIFSTTSREEAPTAYMPADPPRERV